MKCKYCKQTILNPRVNQVYCSQSCRQMAYHERKFTTNKATGGTNGKERAFSVPKIEKLLASVFYVSNKLQFYENREGVKGNQVAETLMRMELNDLLIDA